MACLFFFVIVYFSWTEVLNFNGVQFVNFLFCVFALFGVLLNLSLSQDQEDTNLLVILELIVLHFAFPI